MQRSSRRCTAAQHCKSPTEAMTINTQLVLYCRSGGRRQVWKIFTARMSSFRLLSSHWSASCLDANKITSSSDATLDWSTTLRHDYEVIKKKNKTPNHRVFQRLIVVKVCVGRKGNSDEATLSRDWFDHRGKQSTNILTAPRSLCIKPAAAALQSLRATAEAEAGSELRLHVLLDDNSAAQELSERRRDIPGPQSDKSKLKES